MCVYMFVCVFDSVQLFYTFSAGRLVYYKIVHHCQKHNSNLLLYWVPVFSNLFYSKKQLWGVSFHSLGYISIYVGLYLSFTWKSSHFHLICSVVCLQVAVLFHLHYASLTSTFLWYNVILLPSSHCIEPACVLSESQFEGWAIHVLLAFLKPEEETRFGREFRGGSVQTLFKCLSS